jgi:hypothetical protein
VGFANDLEAVALIETSGWVISEHEQTHRLCRPALLLPKQSQDLGANALSPMLRYDIKLLQEEFVTSPSKLHPTDFLTIESYDPGIVRTSQGGKLGLLVCIGPLYPGTCKRSDRFDVEFKSKGIVVRTSRSEGNDHRRV